MAGAPRKPRATAVALSGTADGKPGGPGASCVQRIEAATIKRTQAPWTEGQNRDAEALFQQHDINGTAQLPRGTLTEIFREVGLEEVLGSGFASTAKLLFDAHSADSHFLTLPEFKQLYYHASQHYPDLLPRPPILKVTIYKAKGLPPSDLNGKSDPYCVFQVVGKPNSRNHTRHLDKTLDPIWNEELDDRYAYEEGDSLEFKVMDYDRNEKGDLLGKAVLASSEFHKEGGFDGELTLTETGKGFTPTLRVRVVVNALEQCDAESQATRRSSKTGALKGAALMTVHEHNTRQRNSLGDRSEVPQEAISQQAFDLGMMQGR